jgi:hypothetical protein
LLNSSRLFPKRKIKKTKCPGNQVNDVIY